MLFPALDKVVNEGKFTPAPGKIIFLTWEKNFLSEVGIFFGFSRKDSVKDFAELQKFRQLLTLFYDSF